MSVLVLVCDIVLKAFRGLPLATLRVSLPCIFSDGLACPRSINLERLVCPVSQVLLSRWAWRRMNSWWPPSLRLRPLPWILCSWWSHTVQGRMGWVTFGTPCHVWRARCPPRCNWMAWRSFSCPRTLSSSVWPRHPDALCLLRRCILFALQGVSLATGGWTVWLLVLYQLRNVGLLCGLWETWPVPLSRASVQLRLSWPPSWLFSRIFPPLRLLFAIGEWLSCEGIPDSGQSFGSPCRRRVVHCPIWRSQLPVDCCGLVWDLDTDRCGSCQVTCALVLRQEVIPKVSGLLLFRLRPAPRHFVVALPAASSQGKGLVGVPVLLVVHFCRCAAWPCSLSICQGRETDHRILLSTAPESNSALLARGLRSWGVLGLAMRASSGLSPTFP